MNQPNSGPPPLTKIQKKIANSPELYTSLRIRNRVQHRQPADQELTDKPFFGEHSLPQHGNETLNVEAEKETLKKMRRKLSDHNV